MRYRTAVILLGLPRKGTLHHERVAHTGDRATARSGTGPRRAVPRCRRRPPAIAGPARPSDRRTCPAAGPPEHHATATRLRPASRDHRNAAGATAADP